jgi:hypothetical protein
MDFRVFDQFKISLATDFKELEKKIFASNNVKGGSETFQKDLKQLERRLGVKVS